MSNSTKPLTTRLDDGTEIVLRPVGPDDKQLLEEGMARLSPESRRLRFLAPIDQLSRSQLAYLTEVDQQNHIAWGALVDGAPVAIARLVRLAEPSTDAELAVTVVDGWQRRGLGSLLVRLMVALARPVGIERIVFTALPENRAIILLFQGLGAVIEVEDGLVSGTLTLAAPLPAGRFSLPKLFPAA
ncbi:MAG: GNAT family N-acetyltransferase [Actinomycetota bacterium]